MVAAATPLRLAAGAAASLLLACAPPDGGMPGSGPASAPKSAANPAPNAGANVAKEKNMSDPAHDEPLPGLSFDSGPAPQVDPVELDGRRYAARNDGGIDAETGQVGGLIDVIDMVSGKRLRTIKVYDNRRREGPDAPEGDAQDIFIARITLAPGGKLLVVDEVNRHFLVDPATGTSVPQ